MYIIHASALELS